ncbi:MAG: twin-arginine translocation signal domain-containing protein [Planctomycetes bacterium]|nr:twin-arginine translocation signal domain-containing protein [Planctomycetota bacterium]
MSNDREHSLNRRDFLATGLLVGAAVTAGGLWLPSAARAEGNEFGLPELGYAPDALEPIIDKQTMEIHHGKHHAAYVANLNKALKDQPKLAGLTVGALLVDKAGEVPSEIRQAVINNGGGHANHSLFWSVLGPKEKVKAAPTGKLAEAIQSGFGGVEKLAEKVNEEGLKRFGSGWTWLVKDKDGKLHVYSTANQDSPLMQKHVPIFGIDVWEHAYYLKYQNKRGDYLKAIWGIVNWSEVERRYDEELLPDTGKEKDALKKAREAK